LVVDNLTAVRTSVIAKLPFVNITLLALGGAKLKGASDECAGDYALITTLAVPRTALIRLRKIDLMVAMGDRTVTGQ
jgi:hypothetical protein